VRPAAVVLEDIRSIAQAGIRRTMNLMTRIVRSVRFRTARMVEHIRRRIRKPDPFREQIDKMIKPGVKDHPMFAHEFDDELDLPAAAFGEETDEPQPTELVERIAGALRKELDIDEYEADDVWKHFRERHKELIELLENDEPGARAYLAKMFATPLALGFQQGDLVYDSLKSSRKTRERVVKNHLDKLAGLAESLGCVPVENPEAGPWAELVHMPPDEMLDRISAALGWEFQAPGFQGGLYGIVTRRGLVTSRDMAGLYVAHRASAIVLDKHTPVCEIGAGAGYTAFYLWHLGYRHITLIDLPTVNVAQTWFLGRNLPDARLILSGEDGVFSSEEGIRILTPRYFALVPGDYFALVINVDSMPEIDEEIVTDYLRRMKRNTKRFLSINHEGMHPLTAGKRHLRVADVVDKVGGFRRLARFPFWLRKGYVEQLYEVER